MKAIFIFLILISSQLLSSCGIDGERNKPPEQSVEELRMFGVSLSPLGSLPRSVPIFCSDDGLYLGDLLGLDFYLSPTMDYATKNQIDNIIADENIDLDSTNPNFFWPYLIVFSIQNEGGEFLPIEATLDYTFFPALPLSENIPNEYSSVPEIGSNSQEFILFGDFYLQDNIFSVPVNATHVELWFGESRSEERILVNRTALENLDIWRTFIEPNIDRSNGSARCIAS